MESIAERAVRLMQELHDEGWSMLDAMDVCASATSGVAELWREKERKAQETNEPIHDDLNA